MIPGYGLHDQLELLVQAGLSPLEALRTATVEPAAYLGRETQSGRIAERFAADILLLRADPLSNITAIRKIDTVILRGRVLDQEALQEIMSAGNAGRDEPPGVDPSAQEFRPPSRNQDSRGAGR